MNNPRRLWLGLFCGVAIATCWLALGCGGKSVPKDPQPAPAPQPASRFFEDVTAESDLRFTFRNGEEAGHAAILESLGGGVALIDFDRDGLLDVFVTGGGYFAGPDKKQIKGHTCRLFKNLGGWKFRDVTAEVGLESLADGAGWFYTHGAAVADYDNDGWPDLLVTGWGRLVLYHNEPDPKDPTKRRFVDVTAKAHLGNPSWSTSAAWADFDGDGYPDLYLCHYVNWSFANNPKCPGYTSGIKQDVCPPREFIGLAHRLFRNNRDGTFEDVSKAAG